MCVVPSIAVFCSESIECFPGIVSKFFFKLLVTIPVVPIITGIIIIIIVISTHLWLGPPSGLFPSFLSAKFCFRFTSPRQKYTSGKNLCHTYFLFGVRCSVLGSETIVRFAACFLSLFAYVSWEYLGLGIVGSFHIIFSSLLTNHRNSCKRPFGPDTHPSCLHLTSYQQQLENQTPYVATNAIVLSSLMMGITVPETCWT